MTASTLLSASPEALAFQRTPIITFGYVLQVFFSLLIVLAFIYFIAKYLLPRFKLTSTSKMIKGCPCMVLFLLGCCLICESKTKGAALSRTL